MKRNWTKKLFKTPTIYNTRILTFDLIVNRYYTCVNNMTQNHQGYLSYFCNINY